MKKTLLLILFCLPIFGFGQCTPADGCENGKCTIIYTNAKYIGDCRNSEPNGKGVMTYSNLHKYDGQWLNGEKHGEGAYYYNSSEKNASKKYVGNWAHNKEHGLGSEFYNNGRIWKGKWIEGEQDSGYFNDENYYNPNDIKGGQISSTINLKELIPDHYYISIDFNGLKKDFTFDTGATTLVISQDLLLELKKHGVRIRDLKIEVGTASVASGDKVSTKSYIIDNIRIGDYLLNNVVVEVASKGVSSLCGISLFNKFSNVHWDMQKDQLILYR